MKLFVTTLAIAAAISFPALAEGELHGGNTGEANGSVTMANQDQQLQPNVFLAPAGRAYGSATLQPRGISGGANMSGQAGASSSGSSSGASAGAGMDAGASVGIGN